MWRHLSFVPLLLLLPVACGGPDVPSEDVPLADVMAALEAMDHVLDDDLPAPGWLSSGLEPLRQGRRAIQEGAPGVGARDADHIRRRLREADVVLVADLHPFDIVRTSLGRLIAAHADVEAIREGRVAIAFEAVSQGMGERVEDLVRRRDRAGLLAFFRARWPWPVEAYVDLLLDPRLRGVRVLGASVTKPCPVPGPETADAERTPVPTIDLGFGNGTDLAEWKYGTTFSTNNTVAAYVTRRWIEAGEGRQVFVLYGAAHLLDEAGWSPPSAIVPQLREAVLRVVVVAPFLPSWELALRRRFGADAERTWYEVLDGVLRPPHATAGRIRGMARPAPSAETLTLPRRQQAEGRNAPMLLRPASPSCSARGVLVLAGIARLTAHRPERLRDLAR